MTASGLTDQGVRTRLALDRMIAGALWRMPRARPLFERFQAAQTDRHYGWSMSHPEHFDDQLPPAYGPRLTERAVEFGWVAAQRPRGRVLDAGSALNHRVTLTHLLPMMESLTIVTLAPEDRSFPELGVEYRYEDLRSLSLPGDQFDTIVSVSTLEHVGLDNTRFHGAQAAEGDPNLGAHEAVRELTRVARPGADLLITVPFGASWRDSWVRVFDAGELDDLIAAARPARVQEAIYRRGAGGWQRTDRAGAAGAEFQRFWAEAVACVRLTLPA